MNRQGNTGLENMSEKAEKREKVLINEDERVDDLQRNHYKIIQKKKGFCFGMDAVLLSGFAQVKEGDLVIDLGTGTGIIPILLEAKTKGKHFTGLEIQESVAEMAFRSVCLNGIQDRVKIVQGDIKEASRIFGKASFDVVTSNPPYMEGSHGIKNKKKPIAIAKHEILCTLTDVITAGAKSLKPGGRFYMVHRPFRLPEIFHVLGSKGLEPKRMQMVHPYIDKEPNMVLIEARRGGRPRMKVEKPLIVYKEKNSYSKELMEIYGYCHKEEGDSL